MHSLAPATGTDKRQAIESARTDTTRGAGVRNMQQLIQLRWIAIVGQVATIAFVHFALHIRLPLAAMLGIVAYLALFNLASLLFWRSRQDVGDLALLFALLVDVAALTAQLHLSGGITNPFVFLYLLQVALGAVLLPAWAGWVVVAASCAGVLGLVAFTGPVTLAAEPARGIADPYVQGLLVCFALTAVLAAVFIGRTARILRDRDARLAGLRQQAVEEEHIVRMGLLASGAAHELGTPLATLSVLLGDWRRMAPFEGHPELQQDLDEMQTQLGRCKAIVTGILLSAGDARGEAPAQTTLAAFLDELVEEWSATRPVNRLDYRRRLDGDVPIVSDSGLKQMVGNILDNALEASPDWVGLEAVREGQDGERLRLKVSDAGPGFTEQALANFGKPYNSSKGRPGGGLGLFLSLNVARSFGGRLHAANRHPRGAEVVLELPLSALALEGREPDEPTDE
ncbi:histidine kinase [Pseudoxanthomonas broegbernensis]|uniref:histidine kinase n=1 Tax=Pseudoxanthomonas broegbernensis TaxID=83619 RepID=A0A7V8K885_9GAMM|nr:ATP-binding protein [Pseudoxanthomonas broegbernensis]KAF1687769.1 histidine kinase [Pseudoxanthomonas broegbernensis]MBB6064807.1 two-component system sensor histidine kinase RegB [Pseudoxanthomonas broegbernensis]